MKVTVITPAYNAEKFILGAIESVLLQGISKLEMIVVDDNSSDKTLEILHKASSKYSFLKVFHNSKNMGPAFCRNLAIRNAKGEYLAFLDADDLWLPNKLKLQLNFMDVERIDFSYTSYYLMNEAGESLNTVVTGESGMNYKRLLYNCPIGCLTVIYKKKMFKVTYMPNIPRGQDYGFWLKLFKQDAKVGYIDQPLAKYRKLDKSVSSAKKKKIFNLYKLYKKELSINSIQSVLYISSHIFHSYMKSHGLTHTRREEFE